MNMQWVSHTVCKSLSCYNLSEKQLAVDFKGSKVRFRSIETVILLLNTVSSGNEEKYRQKYYVPQC